MGKKPEFLGDTAAMPSLARFPRATNQILQDHYCTLFYMTVDLNVWTHKYHSQMVAAHDLFLILGQSFLGNVALTKVVSEYLLSLIHI